MSASLPPNVLRPTEADHAPSTWDVPAPYGGRVLDLSEPRGLTALGASIGTLEPGQLPCPLHSHHEEEEVFVVLDGVMTVRELDPGSDRERWYRLYPGELVAYPPRTGIAHQSRNEGDRPLRYLALSDGRHLGELCEYPDSGKTLVRQVGIGTVDQPVEPAVAAARAAAAARAVDHLPDDRRPPHAATAAVPWRDLGPGQQGRPLSRSAGATAVFVNHDRLDVGAWSSPLHWHTRNEELLLVRSGRPLLRQLRDGTVETCRLQPGDLVFWHPGDRVAHQLQAVDEPCELLVIGTDDPADVCVFPEQDALFSRRLGRRLTLHQTNYLTGEHPPVR
ncbi:MAG: cupin domain-containing protein [Alphaproteobacteria bacterium]|nr:cupin domain-containing protein [Alphaproteobacteria bacterium]